MSNGLRSRFGSTNLVLLLLCISCCGCADSAKVVAYLQVLDSASRTLPSSLWPDRPEDELKFFIATQCALLESPLVLKSALGRRHVRELNLVVEHDHSETWLKSILRVQNPADSSILMLSLEGPRENADELMIILDGIIEAYQLEVVAEERISQQIALSELQKAFKILAKDLTYEIERQIALESSSAEDKAGELHVQKLRVSTLEQVARELDMSLIKRKLCEQITSERVKVMLSAFVESDSK